MSPPPAPAYRSTRAAFGAGFWAGLPFCLVVAPFAGLFGAAAREAGLDLAQVMGFSVLVFAGAAQFTALQLMVEAAPVFVVVLAALAVNLRTAMYSAALQPHLGDAPLWQRAFIAYATVDQSYVLSVLDWEGRGPMPVAQKVAFFLGTVATIGPLWYISTLAGALIGAALLPSDALSYGLPVIFLAMVGPALRTLAHVAAAGTAALAALLLAGLPYGLGLLPAALLGMVVGAEVERRRSTR